METDGISPLRYTRKIFVLVLMSLVAIQVIILSPRPLDWTEQATESGTSRRSLLEFVRSDGPSIISFVPRNRIPSYGIQNLSFISAQKGVRQWRLVAEKAYMYQPENLMHVRRPSTTVYNNEDGTETILVSDEALYHQGIPKLEAFGNVEVIFPDGFKIKSPYALYFPTTRHLSVPNEHRVFGEGTTSEGSQIRFEGNGIEYHDDEARIILKQNVKVFIEGSKKKTRSQDNQDTEIFSDHAEIRRNERIAHFRMFPERPATERFVRITQPTMNLQGRTVDMHYGESGNAVHYIVAEGDVTIRDLSKDDLPRYATCGRADFDVRQNIVQLTQFPQVYQGNDTITGQVITLYRETDVVEVEYSNAFSGGNQNPSSSSLSSPKGP